jgi:DNA polymerase III delta subunit
MSTLMSTLIDGIGDLVAVRCFVLRGEDTVSRERAREAISAALEAKSGPCIREPFDPASETAALFAQRMLTPSLFQETRIFHLRHAQTLGDDDIGEIDAALSGDIEGVYCIIEIDEGKKDAGRTLKKLHIDERLSVKPPTGVLLEFEKPADWKVADWLVDNTPLLIGRRITKQDAEYLAERVGYDVDTLHSELQKIDLYLPPGAPVTRAAIDRLTAREREMKPFELAAAAGRRDFPLALRVIEALFSVTVYMPLVVSALGRHFWALFRIKKFLAANPGVARRFAASKGSKNQDQTETGLAIGKAAGLFGDGEERKIYPVLIKSGIVDQTRGFSEDELARILGWLLEFDTGIKTGRIEPTRNNLQMLSYRIIRGETALTGNGGA